MKKLKLPEAKIPQFANFVFERGIEVILSYMTSGFLENEFIVYVNVQDSENEKLLTESFGKYF